MSYITWWVVVTLLGGVVEGVGHGGCPKKCFCDNSTLIAHCSKKALQSLPETFPAAMAEANFNFNPFKNPVITRSNMTLFSNLTNLYLGGCHIEHITENTFVDMKRLQILDLSENRLTLIGENTFRGLELNHLFLHSNKLIVLTASSFEGLSTNGLHLHGCSLNSLPFNVFQPFQHSLTNLWLDDNLLSHIDVRFETLFQKLHHLRLNDNPFQCDCKLSWLKDFFEANPAKFKDVKPISCGSPSNLAHHSLTDVSRAAFECKTPTFRNINAFFNVDRAILKCSASGNPTPNLYWIQPNGITKKYEPRFFKTSPFEGDFHDQIEAVLNLQTSRHHHHHRSTFISSVSFDEQSSSLETGMYICVAENQVGNVSLIVNVTWPPGHRFKSTRHHRKQYEEDNKKVIHKTEGNNENRKDEGKTESRRDRLSLSPVSKNIDKHKKDEYNRNYNNDPNYHNNDYPHPNQQYDSDDVGEVSMRSVSREGIFTLAEMVVAIIATHLLTIALVLCLMLVRNAILRSRRQKSRYVDEPKINSTGPLIGSNARMPTHAINADPTYDKVGNIFSDVYTNSSVSNFPRLVNR